MATLSSQQRRVGTEAKEVAKGIIRVAKNEQKKLQNEYGNDDTSVCLGSDLTHLKLQKLLYFAQAAHLALHNKPLFDDEIQAWPLGPVVPSVYHVYKDRGSNRLELSDDETINLTSEQIEFIGEVWDMFGKYSSEELVEMTHRHAPWKKVYVKGQNNLISNDSIKRFYSGTFSCK